MFSAGGDNADKALGREFACLFVQTRYEGTSKRACRESGWRAGICFDNTYA